MMYFIQTKSKMQPFNEIYQFFGKSLYILENKTENEHRHFFMNESG